MTRTTPGASDPVARTSERGDAVKRRKRKDRDSNAWRDEQGRSALVPERPDVPYDWNADQAPREVDDPLIVPLGQIIVAPAGINAPTTDDLLHAIAQLEQLGREIAETTIDVRRALDYLSLLLALPGDELWNGQLGLNVTTQGWDITGWRLRDPGRGIDVQHHTLGGLITAFIALAADTPSTAPRADEDVPVS